MRTINQFFLVTCCWVATVVRGHPEYQALIPNGDSVKDINGNVWPGVGHIRSEGSGPLNPFGVDFQNAGYQWTTTLCQKDSDGDGATNGQELGDPHCVWTPGAQPAGPAVSHPGFPGDVKGIVDTCANFVYPTGYSTMTLQFTQPFPVPTSVTNYPRQAFDLRTIPGAGGNVDAYAYRFDIIYGAPVQIIHHILIYSCTQQEINGYTAGPILTSASPCSGGIVFGWAIGGPRKLTFDAANYCVLTILPAYCLPSGVAIRFKASNPYVLMEVHLNNADQASGLTAQPGFNITAMPLDGRPQPPTPIEANWLWLGASLKSITIPAANSYVEVVSTVKVPATPVVTLTIIATLSHMHYIGRRLWVEAYSDSAPTRSLACNPYYDNQNQEVIPLSPYLTISNGDTVVTHCVYNSINRTTTTVGGESTENEMCFAFLLFTSTTLEAPYTAVTAGTVSTSPQATQVVCAAADEDGPIVPEGLSAVPSLIIAHATFAAIGMGFLVPLAAMFPASRKFRARGPIWFKLHWIVMTIGVVFGWTAFGLGASYNPSFLTSAHGRMGTALTSLTIFQVLIGKFRPHLPHDADESKSQRRKAFEWIHPVIGWTIMGCIAVQVYWGYTLLEAYFDNAALEGWKYAHAIGFFILWACLMAFLHPPPFLRRNDAFQTVPTAKIIDDDHQIAAYM